MADVFPVPARSALRFALVGVLVFAGVATALASALCILAALDELLEFFPERINFEGLGMLATGGAGFLASLTAPAWAWWHLLPRTRRAGVLTMATMTWLSVGGIGALMVTVQTVEAMRPHETVPVDPATEDRLRDSFVILGPRP